MLRPAVLVLLVGIVSRSAAALPLISEAFYDAIGTDNGLSFVELFGAPGTDLGGLVLEGVNGANGNIGPAIALSGAIPADGFFVVADDRGDGASDVPGADLIANFDFQNANQALAKSRGYSAPARGFSCACASAQRQVCS
jgi:hypothetical protein